MFINTVKRIPFLTTHNQNQIVEETNLILTRNFVRKTIPRESQKKKPDKNVGNL